MTTCRYNGSSNPCLLNGQHGNTCSERDWHPPLEWTTCAGCEPCPRPHCGVCGIRHVEQLTCPSCIGDVRTDIADIARMAPRAYFEAIAVGTESEAAHLAGPVAQPEAWRQRRRAGYRDDAVVRTKSGGIIGEEHPLWVLGTWDLQVTEHYNHRRTQRVGIDSAAAYLTANLSRLAQDPDFAFEDLATDVRAGRGHLEDVLHEGEQIETGAPCMTCRVPLTLVRGVGEDQWKCARCKQTSTDAQYRYAVMHLHREHAPWVTAAEVEFMTGIKPATLRKRVERGELTSRRDSGRTVYEAAAIPEVAAHRQASA